MAITQVILGITQVILGLASRTCQVTGVYMGSHSATCYLALCVYVM